MDFPDPEEEFDMMYAEELELMRELEGKGGCTDICWCMKELPDTLTGLCVVSDQCSHADRGSCPKSKRSLDFSSPKAPSPMAPALGVMDDVELQLPEVSIVHEVLQLVYRESNGVISVDYNSIQTTVCQHWCVIYLIAGA